jgi:L-lactate dehydrogenase complex protein LldG
MTTRDIILQSVLDNQPPATALPDIGVFKGSGDGVIEKYIEVFKTIGGNSIIVEDIAAIKDLVNATFDASKRIITTLPELSDRFEMIVGDIDPHMYEDAEVAIISAHFGVAENGAVWLTEDVMGQRIIPYICQHLVVIIKAGSIVPTLHEAYERIGAGDYGFGGFIGGPSKTADIEQALVLGAHGPLSMIVCIIK